MTPYPFRRLIAAVAALSLGLTGPLPAYALRAGLEGREPQIAAALTGLEEPLNPGVARQRAARALVQIEIYERMMDSLMPSMRNLPLPKPEAIKQPLLNDPPDIDAAKKVVQEGIETVEAWFRPPLPAELWARRALVAREMYSRQFEHVRNNVVLPILSRIREALSSGLEEAQEEWVPYMDRIRVLPYAGLVNEARRALQNSTVVAYLNDHPAGGTARVKAVAGIIKDYDAGRLVLDEAVARQRAVVLRELLLDAWYVAHPARRVVPHRLPSAAGMEELPVAPEVFASLFDHTNFRPPADPSDAGAVAAERAAIEQTAREAKAHGYALVAVRPGNPALWAAEVLQGSAVKSGPAIGFRLLTTKYDGGNMTRERALDRYEIPVVEKVSEIQDTITAMRNRFPTVGYEVDFVINVKALLDPARGEQYVRDEIRTLIQVVRDLERPNEHITVKVIGENYFLSDAWKRLVYGWAKQSGADFVKTSTGFAPTGATEADLRLMREVVGPGIGVKAAGGIRTLDEALAMLRAADAVPIDPSRVRLGLSASVAIEAAYRQAYAAKAVGMKELTPLTFGHPRVWAEERERTAKFLRAAQTFLAERTQQYGEQYPKLFASSVTATGIAHLQRVWESIDAAMSGQPGRVTVPVAQLSVMQGPAQQARFDGVVWGPEITRASWPDLPYNVAQAALYSEVAWAAGFFQDSENPLTDFYKATRDAKQHNALVVNKHPTLPGYAAFILGDRTPDALASLSVAERQAILRRGLLLVLQGNAEDPSVLGKLRVGTASVDQVGELERRLIVNDLDDVVRDLTDETVTEAVFFHDNVGTELIGLTLLTAVYLQMYPDRKVTWVNKQAAYLTSDVVRRDLEGWTTEVPGVDGRSWFVRFLDQSYTANDPAVLALLQHLNSVRHDVNRFEILTPPWTDSGLPGSAIPGDLARRVGGPQRATIFIGDWLSERISNAKPYNPQTRPGGTTYQEAWGYLGPLGIGRFALLRMIKDAFIVVTPNSWAEVRNTPVVQQHQRKDATEIVIPDGGVVGVVSHARFAAGMEEGRTLKANQRFLLDVGPGDYLRNVDDRLWTVYYFVADARGRGVNRELRLDEPGHGFSQVTDRTTIAKIERLAEDTRNRGGLEENQQAARVEAAEMIRRALDEAPAGPERQVAAISPAVMRQAGYADAVTFLQSVPALQGRVVMLPDVTPQDTPTVVHEKVDGFFSALPPDALVLLYARFDELAAASVVGRFNLRAPFSPNSPYRFAEQQTLSVGLEEFLGQILRGVGIPAARSAELAPKIVEVLGLGQAA